MSQLGPIQEGIVALLVQLQASHYALEQDNGRLVAENNTLSAVLHSQAVHITELQKTIQAPKVPLAQRQKL